MLKPKLKHVLHPMRTLQGARLMFDMHLDMRRIAARADVVFAADPRYVLQHVSDGFASRLDARTDDSALLDRICSAYRAAEASTGTDAWYEPTAWWKQIRNRSLAPVIHALRNRDLATLQRLYANFFRDPCSGGLIGVPYGMSKVYVGQTMSDRHRRVYLSDALHRLDVWDSEMGGEMPVATLRGPNVGNPFGIMLEKTLIPHHADFRHACAHRVGALLDVDDPLVCEIGGGFGGMAYYLLRDFPRVRYTDFDLPETIALASYYLIKAFPERTFMLYGEPERDDADVRLLPLCAMDEAPNKAAEVTFSSHALSDLAPSAAHHYLSAIERMTRGHFLVVETDQPDHSIAPHIASRHPYFRLVGRRTIAWSTHRTAGVPEVDLTYAVRDMARHEATNREALHASR